MLALLVTVAGIHLVALMSPGPDFFYVSQVAASHARKDALKAVLGISLGVFIWAAIALLGLHVLLQKMAWLHTGIMLAGGSYLCYLAYLLIRSAFSHHQTETAFQSGENLETAKNNHLFLKGLLTNLANPKALVYFGSVFSMFVGDAVSTETRLWIFSLIVVETVFWFAIVALIFALPPIRLGYQRLAKWVDGVAGLLFAGFGISLIYKALRP